MSSAASADNDVNCLAMIIVDKNGNQRQCKNRRKGPGSDVCGTHAKVREEKAKRAKEAEEREENAKLETQAAEAIKGAMDAVSEQIAKLNEGLESLRLTRREHVGTFASKKELRTLGNNTKALLQNVEVLDTLRNAVLSSCEDTCHAAERDRQIEELKTNAKRHHEEMEKAMKQMKEDLKELKKLKKLENQRIPKEGKFMSRGDYRKLFESIGIDVEDKHVFHIIANTHGGPDHTDNYLFTLGSSFNQSIKHELDHLNCFMAGKKATEKAVAIAKRCAEDINLHPHIEKRGGKRTLYTDGVHRNKNGQELYKEGEALVRTLRALNRAEDNERRTVLPQ